MAESSKDGVLGREKGQTKGRDADGSEKYMTKAGTQWEMMEVSPQRWVCWGKGPSFFPSIHEMRL